MVCSVHVVRVMDGQGKWVSRVNRFLFGAEENTTQRVLHDLREKNISKLLRKTIQFVYAAEPLTMRCITEDFGIENYFMQPSS